MAHKGQEHEDVRLVVLIDGETSSAAEIVAGAMRLHERAALVGSRTRGKTWVQNVQPFEDLGLLVMSTARSFLVRPGKPDSACEGFEYVEPDAPVDIGQSVQPRLARLRARARALPGRPRFKPLGSSYGSVSEELRRLDAQLARAVALLKDPPELDRILKSKCYWIMPEDE